jgi:hypothetical protein
VGLGEWFWRGGRKKKPAPGAGWYGGRLRWGTPEMGDGWRLVWGSPVGIGGWYGGYLMMGEAGDGDCEGKGRTKFVSVRLTANLFA